MKVIIALAALVAVAVAAPQRDADAVIVRQTNDNIGLDSYNYAYETSNGISADESGQIVNPGTENESINTRGSFAYTGPDGVRYVVNYIADDNGFQPVGAHIPQ